MKNKEVLIFLGGLTCGIIIGVVLGLKAVCDLRVAVDHSANEITGNIVTVVVTRSSLAKNTILTRECLGIMEMREENLPLNYISAEAEKNAYLGKRLIMPIKQLEPLSWDYLKSSNDLMSEPSSEE